MRNVIAHSILLRVPTVLEKSLNFGFSLKSPWKCICPWKVLEFRGPSLKFQLVVLDFLFYVFWTESLNGYSKLRSTRANFPPKKSARFARSSLQMKYFSSSSCSYIIRRIVISLISQIYLHIFMYVMFFNVSICFKIGSLYSYCGIITKLVYPPELSRIAGICINSNKHFLGEDPQTTPFKQNCLKLYYNDNAANLKKLKTHTQIPPPPPCTIFLANSRSNSLCMSYLKSQLLIIFSRIDIWKNKETSLKSP